MPLIFLLIIKSRYSNNTRARLLQLQLTVTLYSDNFKDFLKNTTEERIFNDELMMLIYSKV